MESQTNIGGADVLDGKQLRGGILRLDGDLDGLAPWTQLTPRNLFFFAILPLFAVVILSALIRGFDLDLRVSRCFFCARSDDFPARTQVLWACLYRYGPIPGLVLGIGAAFGWAWSFFSPARRTWRFPCMIIALLLALGPGLIVNGILKPTWDRPRPCELEMFGGCEQFVPVLNLEIECGHHSKSFPSGHASIGFFLLAPIFVLRSRWRLSAICLLLGLSIGLAMGIGRIVQGRHFMSDVLWSGALVYFTGLAVAYGARGLRCYSLQAARVDELDTSEPVIHRFSDAVKSTVGSVAVRTARRHAARQRRAA